MKSRRKARSVTARLLVVTAGIAALAGSAVASGALGATAVAANAPMNDRLANAPDTTVLHLGSLSTTLGAMRAAHRAREASLAQAAALGLAAHGKLTTVVGTRTLTIAGARTGNVGGAPALKSVVEPPSQYASAPADMKAFCSAAAASACLYLPPGQVLEAYQGTLVDYDSLVTTTQCTQEGGSVLQGQLGPYCAFKYPTSVIVHFTPATNYQLSQSAHCNANLYAHTVDSHGAIQIVSTVSSFTATTGNDATCIVTVTPGG